MRTSLTSFIAVAALGLASWSCGSPTPAPVPDLSASGQSCCGKSGDAGNSKGVGKYCTDPSGSECRVNVGGATVCSSLGDSPSRKTTFCTMECKGQPAGFCGEGASCTFSMINNAYGCTPDACVANLPPGCSI